MIRTADRMGHITEEDSFQNNLLEKIYGSVAGRMLIRPLVTPVVSIAMGWILDSRLSAAAVKPFIRFCPDFFKGGGGGGAPAILIWNRDILSVPVTAG